MVQQSTDDLPSDDVQVEDDPFLSPEMQEMQRKIRKMVFWSILVMVLGISSVIGVLIYKSVTKKESAAVEVAPNTPITHVLKSGETIRTMLVEGGVVYLLVDGKGMASVIQIDKKTGGIERRVEFIPQGK